MRHVLKMIRKQGIFLQYNMKNRHIANRDVFALVARTADKKVVADLFRKRSKIFERIETIGHTLNIKLKSGIKPKSPKNNFITYASLLLYLLIYLLSHLVLSTY